MMFGSGKMSLGPLHLGEETVEGPVSANGQLSLKGTTVRGTVHANGNMDAYHATIQGDVNINGQADLMSSNLTGHITITGMLDVISSHIKGNVHVVGSLKLRGSTIEGNVIAPSPCFIEHSTIEGECNITGTHLVLDGSRVKTIVLGPLAHHASINESMGQMNDSMKNMFAGSGFPGVSDWMDTMQSTMSNAMSMTNNIVMSGGSNYVSVSPGSQNYINGYGISASNNDTTVTTPDGSTYVNGKRVAGEGPDTYAGYQSKYPQAPTVDGPGWPDSDTVTTSTTTDPGVSSNAPALYVIELKNGSQVTGTIRFPNQRGKVVVSADSSFSGRVEGGIVEHAS